MNISDIYRLSVEKKGKVEYLRKPVNFYRNLEVDANGNIVIQPFSLTAVPTEFKVDKVLAVLDADYDGFSEREKQLGCEMREQVACDQDGDAYIDAYFRNITKVRFPVIRPLEDFDNFTKLLDIFGNTPIDIYKDVSSADDK